MLFLDELAEFPRNVIEALRQPLEDGEVLVARVGGRARMPADVQLVAAMNPCPCGGAGSCACTPDRVEAYRARLSGPLLDRLDLVVRVDRPDPAAMRRDRPERSAAVADRVGAARHRQVERGQTRPERPAARSTRSRPRRSTTTPPTCSSASRRRARSRAGRTCAILRVARTAADLAGETVIGRGHVAEALALRGSAGALG